MQKEITIQEGNRVIAEFMGWKFVEADNKYAAHFKKHGGDFVYANRLEYHTSWDWLMPVVEKIESIGKTCVSITHRSCEITPIIYSVKKDRMVWHQTIFVMHENKIASTYAAVLQFITWYNTTNK